MRGIRPRTILKVMAGLVLFLLSAGSASALTATDCATCHGADVVEGHHDTVDPNSYFNQKLCGECHLGIITGNDCSACHEPTGFNNQHHTSTGNTPVCGQCHADAGNPLNVAPQPSVCTLCHRGDNPPVPILTFHHTQLKGTLLEQIVYDANGSLNCAACHSDTEETGGCASCHGPGGIKPVTRESHHAAADTSNRPCANCHAGTVPNSGSCQGCHVPRVKMAFHHDFAETYSIVCSYCHSGLTSSETPPQSRTGCKECHAAAPEPLHHDTVMSERRLDCGNCHAGAPAISSISGFTGCATCHTGGIATTHHTNSPDYVNGNCGACHTAEGLVPTSCDSVACHPKLGPSLMARHHSIDSTRYNLSCSSCHIFSSSGIESPDPDFCILCHEGTVGTTGIQAKHHMTKTATDGNCAACHSGASTTGGECATCHGPGQVKPVAPGSHHSAAEAQVPPTACVTCHAQITPPTSCATATCHPNAGSGAPESRHHLMGDSSGTLYACNTCHSGSSNIYQSCQSCHEALNGPAQTMVQEHHARSEYTDNNCTICHPGFAAATSCDQCHAPGGFLPASPQSHHVTADYSAGNCAACHGNIDPANINCAGCHISDNLSRHHSSTRSCVECHKLQLLGESCKDCHGTSPEEMAEFHHDTGPEGPLTAVGGNCGACHQTINDPSVCANCHTSTPHHATTWSQTGDCAHCHAVPATAADRPVQAACRECHGVKMHDKGGPIQNYGACAACHSTSPFHGDLGIPNGSESRAPTNTGPGRGKFNIFMARNSAQGEQDQWKPRTQITFSTKSISHEGKSYTVPYFTGMATGNLALKKTATASRSESGYSPSLAIDGDVATRWWAKSTSAQWLKVDLGAVKTINKVALRWHSYYATEYEVRVSTDNSSWTRVADANYGKGGLETWAFTTRNVRYIQIYCQRASSYNGFAIYELEAYAP